MSDFAQYSKHFLYSYIEHYLTGKTTQPTLIPSLAWADVQVAIYEAREVHCATPVNKMFKC